MPEDKPNYALNNDEVWCPDCYEDCDLDEQDRKIMGQTDLPCTVCGAD